MDKGLRGAKSGLQGFDKSIGKSVGLLGKLGNVFTGIFKKGLAVAVGLGIFRAVQKIGGALEEAVGQAIAFNEEMANVASIAHLDDSGIAQLTDDVLKLAEDKRIVDMPKTLAAGLYDIVSAGFEAADAITILSAAAIAATAGRTTTEVSAGVISGILNTYVMDASHATEVSNQLFKIVDKGVVTFEELASTIGYVLPTAKALGIGLDEVGAAYISMTRQNIDASHAATNLSGILNGLLKPTDAMKEVIASLGYESGAAMLQALGLSGAIQAVLDTTGGDAGEAAKLFGDIRALRGIIALTNDDAALYKEGLGDMSHAQDGAGATAIALKEQMKSVRFQLRLLHKNVILFFTEGLGQKSMKKVAAFIAIFNRFFDRLFKLRREFNGLKAFLLSFHTLLHQLFGMKVGDAIFEAFREGIRIIRFFKRVVEGDWAGAWDTLKRIGRDGGRFLDWLWSTITDVFNAINWDAVGQALWTGVQYAVNFLIGVAVPWLGEQGWALVKAIWNVIDWDAVGGIIWTGLQAAFNFVTTTAPSYLLEKGTDLLNALFDLDWEMIGGNIWAGLKTAILFVVDLVVAEYTWAGEQGWKILKGLWNLDWNAVGTAVWNGLWTAMQYVGKLGAIAIDAIVDLAGDLKAIRDDAATWIRTALGWTGDKTIQVGKVILEGDINLKDTGTGAKDDKNIWDKIGDFADKVPGAISTSIKAAFNLGTELADLTEWIIGKLVDGLVFAVENANKDNMTKIGKGIVAIFAGIAFIQDFINLPGKLINAFVQGFITELTKDYVIAPFRDFANWIIDTMKGVLGIASPSTVFADIGGWLVQGLLSAFDFNTIFNFFWNIGTAITGGMISGMSSLWSSFAAQIDKMISKAKEVKSALQVSSPSKFMKEVFSNYMQGAILSIQKGIPSLEQAVKSVSDASMNLRPSAPAMAGSSNASGGRSHTLNIAEGAIVVQDSSNPEATAAVILKRIRFIQAGATE